MSARLPTIALLLLTSLSVHAAAPVSGDPAAGFGRLFFSPEKRTALERQRLYNIQEARTLQGATMSLDGIVRRSDGKATVWVNGRPQTDDDVTRSGVSVQVDRRNPSSARLAPGEEAPTSMRVGEAVNRATGERNDRLGGGVLITPGTGKR